MAVRVGPFQRIVGVHWPEPDPAPKYLSATLNFHPTTNYAEQFGDDTETPWDDSFGVGAEYLTSEVLSWDISPDDFSAPSGVPAAQSAEYDAWQYVDQRSFIGSWFAKTFWIASPLTGSEISDGPVFAGNLPRAQTSITIGLYHVPYTGTPKRYATIYDGRLFAQFGGVHSPATQEALFAATTGTGSMTFDFSGVTTTYLGKDYTAYGLNIFSSSTYGIDADFASYRLIFKKNGA